MDMSIRHPYMEPNEDGTLTCGCPLSDHGPKKTDNLTTQRLLDVDVSKTNVPPQVPFPFLGLPREIRTLIYEELLTCNTSTKKQSLSSELMVTDHQTTTAILLANRQIYREARPVLLRRNTFVRVNCSNLKGDHHMFDGIGIFRVPLLAIDRTAREFEDVALELTLSHRTTEFLIQDKEFTCLMLASSLEMVPEILTMDGLIDWADETGNKGRPYTRDEGAVKPSGPETLRLMESGGRVMGLGQQRQILAPFRRDLPGQCTLVLEGPWDTDLAAAAKADVNIGIIKMKPVKNFLETIKRDVQRGRDYAAQKDYQNAFRLLDSANSRFAETYGEDISNEKCKKAVRDLGAVCFSDIGIVLRALSQSQEEVPVEWVEARKLLVEMDRSACVWLERASLLPGEAELAALNEDDGWAPHLLYAQKLAKDIKLETILQ